MVHVRSKLEWTRFAGFHPCLVSSIRFISPAGTRRVHGFPFAFTIVFGLPVFLQNRCLFAMGRNSHCCWGLDILVHSASQHPGSIFVGHIDGPLTLGNDRWNLTMSRICVVTSFRFLRECFLSTDWPSREKILCSACSLLIHPTTLLV